jgi:hypothetical protein
MKKPRRLTKFIQEYRLLWAYVTLVLYIIAIPVTVIVFPTNSMWLGLLVLFSGFTASLTTLADLLVSAEHKDQDE